MSEPCQVCGQPAVKEIKTATEVHNLSDHYTTLTSIQTKFELCDLCADALLERYAKDARNFGMGRMQDGTPRRAIAAKSYAVEATDHNGDAVEAEVVEEPKEEKATPVADAIRAGVAANPKPKPRKAP